MAALRRGQSQEDAAIAGGVAPRTFQNWLARGRSSSRGEYLQFLQDCEQARVTGKSLLVKKFYDGALANPDRAAKFLARRYPKEWGPRAMLEVETPPPAPKSNEDLLAELTKRLDAMEERRRQAQATIDSVPGLRQIAESFSDEGRQ